MDTGITEQPVTTFSIIVPLYNKAEYVERCLGSIIAQTEQSFELIVVDDCSTDESVSKALEILQGNPDLQWKLLQRRKRGGSCAPPRATGVRHASGRFVAFLDADDEWTPSFLTSMLRLIEAFPQAEAFAADRELFADGHWKRSRYAKIAGAQGDHCIDLAGFLTARNGGGGNPFRVQAMAFVPEALDDVGGFIHAPRSSDVDLMYRFFLAGKTAAWTADPGVRVYRVPGSTMALTELQNTRPWYYTVRQALDRGWHSDELNREMARDLMSHKMSDLRDALSVGKLDRSYWNNIIFFRAPVAVVFYALATPLPAVIERMLYRLLKRFL